MPKELDDKLIELAKEACKKSYSPYSRFSVGCAILAEDGQVFTGCNIENISLGLTVCAERAAVFNAISVAGPSLKIKKVMIYTPTNKPVTPCGACRQVLSEFGDNITVISVCSTSSVLSHSLKELLPSPAKITLPGK